MIPDLAGSAKSIRPGRTSGRSQLPGAKVVKTTRHDLPEVVESGAPMRPLLAPGEVAPRLVSASFRGPGVPNRRRTSVFEVVSVGLREPTRVCA
jgi:hypothetical protein